MRRIAAAGLAFVVLCGFGVPPYEIAAVPKAQRARDAAVTACRAGGDDKSLSAVMACVVAADGVFAASIGLNDRGPFESFSAQVASLENDNNSGKVVGNEAAKRFVALEDDFFRAIRATYNAYEAEEAQQYARDSAEAAQRDRASMQRMDSMNGMNGMNAMNSMMGN